MHRIMADLMSKDFEVITRPSEENYTMHIPEGTDGNQGRIGVQGVANRIYHPQKLTLTMIKSAALLKGAEYNNTLPTDIFLNPEHAKFLVEPYALSDFEETAVVDALNPMGADLAYSIGRFRFLRAADSTGAVYSRIYSPRVTKLEHTKVINSEYDYQALAVWVEHDPNDNSKIWFSRLGNKRRDASTPDVTWPYIWQEPFNATTLSSDAASGDPYLSDEYKVVDLVEFDDGSIFLVVGMIDKGTGKVKVTCYRSMDCGENWARCGQIYTASSFISVVTSFGHSVSIERINERLIVVYAQHGSDDGLGRFEYSRVVYCSDDFGSTWTLAKTDSANTIWGAGTDYATMTDLVVGRNGVLYTADVSDAVTGVVSFSSTLDGYNFITPAVSSFGVLGSFSMIEDISGCWWFYFVDVTTKELRVAFTNDTPTSSYYPWSATDANIGYGTANSAVANVNWQDVVALPINNLSFVTALATRYDSASNTAWKSSLSELKFAMWSGITPGPITNVDGKTALWDFTWFANCYPSTSDAEPNIHEWTRTTAGGATATLTNDTANNRSYLRFARGAGAGTVIQYKVAFGGARRVEGIEARFGLRVNSGNAVVAFYTSDGANDVYPLIFFDAAAGNIVLYDYYKGGGAGVVATCTPTNWAVTDWAVYHLVFQDDEIHLYRSTDQFAELLNMELILTYDGLGTNAASGFHEFYFGTVPTYSNVASQADFEFMMLNKTGIAWPMLPINQDEDLMGRKAYYYPAGLYGGLSVKFDGTYGVDGDNWTVETGAIYEVENIFVPSPSIYWKSAASASDPTGTEPNEVIKWKQKDNEGQMHQTVQGFAVFNRNWPYCKLEGSENNAAWTTLFDSLATPTLAYILHLEANGASHYNQVKASLPAGAPALHVNRFASTPEISYYLMAIEGDEQYHVYRILENDEDTFYLDQQLAVGIDNGEDFVIFSDRFYYDFSILAAGQTSYLKTQYRYFRLTIYGNDGSGNNIIFPDEDGGLKKLGSIHLGRVYDLPNEEWGISVSLQPAMAVTESRTARKEYRRVGIARRVIGLNYTGIIERGIGINPVVDLNRSLGWGENPLVFIDDADILAYGDSSPGYGGYTHPNPVLCRMVDGYSMTRAAYSYESENQGDETMQLTRNIMDVGGIKLEEVV